MAHDESLLPREAQRYLADLLPVPHPAFLRVEDAVRREGQPAIGRQTGGLLRGLVASLRARRALEVGTNLGYSALWLCDGMEAGGRVEGIEIDPRLAARAQAALDEAYPGRARVRVGAALDVLGGLPAGAYDLVFLDAVKAEYPAYLDHALRLLRPGGIVAADNLLWHGRVWQAEADDEDTRGVREYTRRVFSDARLVSTLVPVEDGLGVSVVRNP